MEIIKESFYNRKKLVQKLAKEIKKGKVLVCLTDTIYGLIGDATKRKVVDRIFKIKNRNRNKPLPIFVLDAKMAKKIAIIGKEEERILKKLWPGQVTIVLERKKKNIIAPSVFGKKKTIGLRIPNKRLLNDLLKVAGAPLVATSANLSGKKGGYKIEDIINEFEKQKIKPDIILDSGDSKNRKPSTVISLRGQKIKILRRGCFSKKELSDMIKKQK